MIFKKKASLLLTMLLLMVCGIIGQTTLTSLHTNGSESQNSSKDDSRKTIVLKAEAETEDSMVVLNERIKTQAQRSSLANPVPGDTSNASTELKYTSGNMFFEVTDNVTGPISDIANATATKTTTETNYTLPIAWLKTVNETSNLNGAYIWKDVISNKVVKKYTLQGQYTGVDYKVTRDKIMTYNFNPAINLTYQDTKKLLPLTSSNLSQATFIGVWGIMNDYSTDKILYTAKGRTGDSLNVTKNSVLFADNAFTNFSYGSSTGRNLFYTSNNGIEGTDVNKFAEKSLRVATYARSTQPNYSLWGESNNSIVTLFDSLTQNLRYFRGATPELLIFDHPLTPMDIRKYETYLAVKYGVSLDTSYYSANGSLIWDYTANKNKLTTPGKNENFNNRITGYGREDAMGLWQKVSTTSYEASPYFSNKKIFESYDSCNSYRMPTAKHLLVIGTQPGNSINNGNYVMFGDNNGSIACVDSLTKSVTATMSRKWLLTTNMPQCTSTSQYLNCSVQNLTVTPKTNFKYDIVKNASSSSGILVSYTPLVGKNGYLAWTANTIAGMSYVTFGTSNQLGSSGTHAYGYGLSDSQVFPVIDGSINYITYSLSIQAGDRVEVEKNDRTVSIRVNGIHYKDMDIRIDSTQSLSPFYGEVYIGSNSSNICMKDFTHGGFVNTGSRVELSYYNQLASGLNSPYGDPYLIIDRSGTGAFTTQTEIYKADEKDVARSKFIFNNIFWNTTGLGKAVFTFGFLSPTGYHPNANSSPFKLNDLPDADAEKNNVLIYYKSLSDLSTVTVKVQMSDPKLVDIQLYDLLGKCLDSWKMTEMATSRYEDIRLPGSGVYILKVVSDHLNYSEKVICK